MNSDLSRRRVVQSLGAGSMVALAGCLGGSDDAETDEHGNEDQPEEGDTSVDDRDIPTENVVYTFGSAGITAVDLSDESTTAVADTPGASWEDVVAGPEHLFAIDNAGNQVHVLDTETGSVTARVDVGSNPVHGFYSPTTEEAWIHSDDEATFYIIDANSPDGVDGTLTVGRDGTGHGKIATTDGRAFVTNTNEDGVYVVDLDERERVETVEFGDSNHTHSLADSSSVQLLHDEDDHDHDGGTHYVEYAGESDLVFVERLGGGHDHGEDGHDHHDDGYDHGDEDGHDHDEEDTQYLHDEDDHDHGDAETVVVDAAEGDVIDHLDVGGALSLSPAGDLLAVIDGDNISFLDATDAHGHTDGAVTLDGASPDSVYFTDEYVFTTNPRSGDIAVLDREEFSEINRIDVPGDHLGEMAASQGDGIFAVAGDDSLVVVETDTQNTELELDIDGIERVQYLSAS